MLSHLRLVSLHKMSLQAEVPSNLRKLVVIKLLRLYRARCLISFLKTPSCSMLAFPQPTAYDIHFGLLQFSSSEGPVPHVVAHRAIKPTRFARAVATKAPVGHALASRSPISSMLGSPDDADHVFQSQCAPERLALALPGKAFGRLGCAWRCGGRRRRGTLNTGDAQSFGTLR